MWCRLLKMTPVYVTNPESIVGIHGRITNRPARGLEENVHISSSVEKYIIDFSWLCFVQYTVMDGHIKIISFVKV